MLKNIASTFLILAACTGASQATTITYGTPSGSATSGGAVDATATFITGTGTLSITLTNLEADPTDVAQLVSDLDFVLSNGATSGSITSSSGEQVIIAGGGSYTTGNTVPTGWGLVGDGSGGLELDALGFIGPKGLIVGPPGTGNKYDSANGSIAGNGAHNPFIDQSATFVLSIPGVTSLTTVKAATFSFGTSAGLSVTDQVMTPEPSAIILVFCGGAVLGILKRRRNA